jgi:hypothetical protein
MKINYNNKKIATACIAFIIGTTVHAQQTQLPLTAPAADTVKEKQLTGYLETNYMRHYLWRGALWGSNDVSQPELQLNYKHFKLTLNCNLNLIPKNLPADDYKKPVVFDEQDVEIGYAGNCKKLEYEVKAMAYFYFNQINTPSTAEVYAKLKYPLLKNIYGFTENAVDIASYKGAWFNNTGLLYQKSFNKDNTELELGVFAATGSAKFSEAYYGITSSASLYTGVKLDVTQYLFGKVYMEFIGEANRYNSKQILESTGRNGSNNFTIIAGIDL